MMPRYRVPMQSGMPPRHFSPMQGRPSISPMMSRSPQMRQGGGLLSKLLGKGNQMGAKQGMNATRAFGVQNTSGGGSLLRSLANPSSLNGFLTNTQKILNTAQQVGPMVQQYGPIVKNLPAIWRMYRGLKESPNLTAEEAANAAAKEETKNETNHTGSLRNSAHNEEPQEISKSSRESPSPSKPKLYI